MCLLDWIVSSARGRETWLAGSPSCLSFLPPAELTAPGLWLCHSFTSADSPGTGLDWMGGRGSRLACPAPPAPLGEELPAPRSSQCLTGWQGCYCTRPPCVVPEGRACYARPYLLPAHGETRTKALQRDQTSVWGRRSIYSLLGVTVPSDVHFFLGEAWFYSCGPNQDLGDLGSNLMFTQTPRVTAS